MKNRYKVVMHGNQPVVEDAVEGGNVKWFPDVLHDRMSRKKAEAHAAFLNAHPTIAELCDGDVCIRSDVQFESCARCGGTGKEPAAPAPGWGGLRITAPGGECSECGGHGENPGKGKTIYALGVKPELAAGIRGTTFTPWFESLADLEKHCSSCRGNIKKELGDG